MKTIQNLALLFWFVQVTPLLGDISQDSIRGQWRFKFVQDDFARLSSVSLQSKGDYQEDGEIAITVDGRELKPNFPFRLTGKWELKGDAVFVTVTNSTAPKFIRVGSILEFKVAKVTDIEIYYYYEADPKRQVYIAPRG